MTFKSHQVNCHFEFSLMTPTFFFSSKNIADIESTVKEELMNVKKYCDVNKLSINNKKETRYMIIASPKKKISINLTACNIKKKGTIKYLGIFIDENLYGMPKYSMSTIEQQKNWLIWLRCYVSVSSLRQLY